MANLTQPLREEHKELLPHIEAIRQAADAIGEMPLSELRPQLDDVYDFLAHHLLPLCVPPLARLSTRRIKPVMKKTTTPCARNWAKKDLSPSGMKAAR